MEYRYGYEEIDYVDGTQDWVWNAPQHVLFLRIRELFDAELCELYARLESEGCWSATSLINEFNDWQAQFPEELWRLDIQRKYIRTYTSSYINGKAYPEFLTERANGRKKSQRSQFERNQEKYMSSKFSGTVASSDDIILRCSVPNEELVVQPNFDMHLIPYSHVYLNVKYNTAPPVRVRAVPNQEYTIEYTDALADIIEIYSASCLKSVGDLSACYLTNGTFAQATKIRELILGSGEEGYKNSNIMTLGLGSNELLNKLDIQNMTGLTHSLDLSGLKNLEELYAFGSGTSGVIFADGGNIRIAEIPDVGTLQMKNLSSLTDEGFETSSTYSLSRLVAEYSELDLIALIENSPNLRQARLIGIDWNLQDVSMLERLYGLAGVTNTGANAERSVLTGMVKVPVIGSSELTKYNAAWSDLVIDPSTVIPQYKVTFVNDDGTIIEEQWINQFENAVAPEVNPTKESTIQYDYTFAGWDGELTNVTANRTITATYDPVLRQYKIKYVSLNGTPIPGYEEPKVGYYGENIPYDGDIPVYTAEEPYTYYLFKGWDKSGFLTGDFDEDGVKVVTAQFDSFVYNVSILENLELSEMTPVQIYALTQKGLANVSHKIEPGDGMSIVLGNDVEYSDVPSQVIIGEKTIFDGETHIDTGIKLFEEDRDFVLAIDYEMYDGNSSNAVLAQCYQDNGSNGFKIWCNPNSDFEGAKLSWGTAVDNMTSINKREMVVIRHIKGDNNLKIYKSTLDSDAVTSAVLERSKTTSYDGTFVLGSAQPEKGYYENHAKGAIYWCKLWYSDLGEATCKELAEWTHEKIDFNVVDLSRRFYLSDNSGGRCSFTVLASSLLDRARAWNSTSTTEGGWGNSKLNKVLNSRLYKALPVQMRSIIKQVKVPSSLGNKSTEVGTSDCYIAIPSVFEVDASKNTAPYDSETMAGTFSIMGGNSDRIRYYEDGTTGAYWLRSPDIGYTGYPWHVNDSGVTTSFKGASNHLGVLIMLSF